MFDMLVNAFGLIAYPTGVEPVVGVIVARCWFYSVLSELDVLVLQSVEFRSGMTQFCDEEGSECTPRIVCGAVKLWLEVCLLCRTARTAGYYHGVYKTKQMHKNMYHKSCNKALCLINLSTCYSRSHHH